MSKRRTFSKETKLSILKEAKENGVSATLLKHGIYPVTYYSWKKKFEQMGKEGFSHGMTPEHLKEIKQHQENRRTEFKIIKI